MHRHHPTAGDVEREPFAHATALLRRAARFDAMLTELRDELALTRRFGSIAEQEAAAADLRAAVTAAEECRAWAAAETERAEPTGHVAAA